jgi:signal peptidase II
MNQIRRTGLFGVALVALVGCDHATKYAAKADLQGHPPKQMITSVLDLRYVENTDVAFNLLRAVPENVRSPLLLGFGTIGVLAMLGMILRRPGRTATRTALVLVLAGALGNLLDRLFRGYVVDFIHVPHWPVFNVADMCVTAGAILLLWTTTVRRTGTPVVA